MTTVHETRDTVEMPRDNGERADGRATDRVVAREFRPRRSIPAAIVALLLLAGSVLGAIEVISYLFDNPAGVLPVSDLARLGRETQWNDALTITVAIVAGLLGLLLLALALWPGRSRAVAMATDRPGLVMAIGEGDIARLAVRAAEGVDGVDHASAQVGRGRVNVRADSPLHETGDLTDQVHRAVSEQLEDLALLHPRPVRVNVRRKEG
jgi:hypothetical protein